jgi:hypothetical protein
VSELGREERERECHMRLTLAYGQRLKNIARRMPVRSSGSEDSGASYLSPGSPIKRGRS